MEGRALMRAVFYALCLMLMIPAAVRAQDASFPGLIHEPLSVTIALPGGSQARLEASVVRPDRPGRFPLIVIVHGTPGGSGPEFLATIARMSPDFYLGLAVAQAKHG